MIDGPLCHKASRQYPGGRTLSPGTLYFLNFLSVSLHPLLLLSSRTSSLRAEIHGPSSANLAYVPIYLKVSTCGIQSDVLLRVINQQQLQVIQVYIIQTHS